jgi:hypothetical protein
MNEHARQLHEAKDRELVELGDSYENMPSKMKRPRAYKIKAIGEHAAAGAVHMMPPCKGKRKLELGEVVVLDEADPRFLPVLRKGQLEATMEAPTRPLIYPTDRLAKYTKPSLAQRDAKEYEAAQREIAPLVMQIAHEYNQIVNGVTEPKAEEERPRRGRPPKRESEDAQTVS